jgi:hypothetical protein
MQKTSHRITSEVGGYILGGLEIVGGAIAGVAGVLTGNVALIGLGVSGVTAGIGSIGAQEAANEKEKQTEENVGDFSSPAPSIPGTSPTTADNGSTPSVNAQTQADIAKERAAEADLQINQSKEQLSQQMLTEQSAEIVSEGGIRASAAARGLKMEGSPAMQLIAQQELGKETMRFTESQGAAAISGMGISRQASYDAAALAGKEQIQYADQQQSNAWLSSFTNFLKLSSSMVDKFWNPSSGGSSSPSFWTGGPQGNESGIDYYGY